MSTSSKKRLSAEAIARCQELFRCPICFGPMRVVQLQSLICIEGHCFDVSRQGYVNVLLRALATKYDRQLFDARRTVHKSGLFDPLNAVLSDIIVNRRPMKEPLTVLDAGCGEGSHLADIREKITAHAMSLLAVGIDISKEGIHRAATDYGHAIWCVADIANLPFANHQFDCILNILSPASYSEFRRTAADDGVVIKVIPERDYLKELRDVLYADTRKRVYSNANTQDHFNDHFRLTDVERIQYQASVEDAWIESLLRMTPLSWGTTEERLQEVRQLELRQITMDFTILVGKIG